MNRRQMNKINKHRLVCESVCGEMMSYSDKKRWDREYHENVIVKHWFRNKDKNSSVSSRSLSKINLDRYHYHYPNRLRWNNIMRVLMDK